MQGDKGVIDTNGLLRERGKTHGRYSDVSGISQAIKMVMRTSSNWCLLSNEMRESLEMIAVKMARVVCGGPEKDMHMEDIIGYAELTMRRSADL